MASPSCSSIKLQKPKAIRPSPSFHLSKSSPFPLSPCESSPYAGSPRLPTLKKSKSDSSQSPIFGSPLRLSSLLTPCQGIAKSRLSLNEIASVETELREKSLWSSDSGCSPFEELCRPENPMVHDKTWNDNDDKTGSSTEEESDQEYKV